MARTHWQDTHLHYRSTTHTARRPFSILFGGCRYDQLDLLFHIFHSLKLNGYQGVPLHNITRDEVQDFTQAELLVDLRYTNHTLNLFLNYLYDVVLHQQYISLHEQSYPCG